MVLNRQSQLTEWGRSTAGSAGGPERRARELAGATRTSRSQRRGDCPSLGSNDSSSWDPLLLHPVSIERPYPGPSGSTLPLECEGGQPLISPVVDGGGGGAVPDLSLRGVSHLRVIGTRDGARGSVVTKSTNRDMDRMAERGDQITTTGAVRAPPGPRVPGERSPT